MPIKIIQNAPAKSRPQNLQGQPATLCDTLGTPAAGAPVRVTRDIELADLKVYQSKYQTSRDGLPPAAQAFKDKVLLAANFPVSDVTKMILQNHDNILFLRLYMTVNDDGDHMLVMAPIDKNKQLIQTSGTYYSEECCGYPPHNANFVGDPILGL